MTWRAQPPESRKWALCVVRGYSRPQVMQWEPTAGLWYSRALPLPSEVHPSEGEWHPLPSHPAFDPVTHAVEPDTRHVEDGLRAQIETMQANAAEQMHCKMQSAFGQPCPKEVEIGELRAEVERFRAEAERLRAALQEAWSHRSILHAYDQKYIDKLGRDTDAYVNRALRAEEEAERLRAELAAIKEPSCVVCSATLDTEPTEPPHCDDCVPSEETKG